MKPHQKVGVSILCSIAGGSVKRASDDQFCEFGLFVFRETEKIEKVFSVAVLKQWVCGAGNPGEKCKVDLFPGA